MLQPPPPGAMLTVKDKQARQDGYATQVPSCQVPACQPVRASLLVACTLFISCMHAYWRMHSDSAHRVGQLS